MPMNAIPKYELIYQHYLSLIREGKLHIGDKLPSENEMSNSFGVSRITVVKALDMLSKDGYISRVQGSGSFVRADFEVLSPANTLKLISLIIPFQPRGRELSLIKVIERELSQFGYLLSVSNSNDDPLLERQLLCQLKSSAQGIILYLSHSNQNEDIFYQLFKEKYPIVLIDKAPLHLPCDCVLSDNFSGGYQIGQRLLQSGHTHFVLIFHPLYQFSSEFHRFTGFLQALQEADIPQENIRLFTMTDQDKDYSEAIALITESASVSPSSLAVVSCNDIVAEKLLRQFRNVSSQLLPTITFAGFDGLFTPPEDVSYLTVRQNPGMIGLTAAQRILEKIETPSLYYSSKIVPVELMDFLRY